MTEMTEVGAAIRKLWWIPLVQGIAALIVGFLLFGQPVKTLLVLMTWMGAYWLVDGIFNLVRAMLGPPREGRLWPAIVGLLGIFGGLYVLAYPMYSGSLTISFVTTLFALTMLVNGVVLAINGRPMNSNFTGKRTWGRVLVGVFYIIGGIVLLMHPGIAATTILLLFSVWAIVVGILQIVAAFELKNA